MSRNWVSKMKKIQGILRAKKIKHIAFIVFVVVMLGWVAFRFAVIASENARVVFNTSRSASDVGAPVETMTAELKTGVLYTPISAKNNRGYVSAGNISNFKSGQKIGNGKIISVSKNIDYNTGMYLVRTSGVEDGVAYAEYIDKCFFVPLYAVEDNTVMISSNNIAEKRAVNITHQDSENVCITSGLSQGDIIILSNVSSGQKVQFKQQF